MAEWHGYILVGLKPGLALTVAQREKVRDTVRSVAVREDRLPQRMFQTRLSLDGSQAIYEAVWDRGKMEPDAVLGAVAKALGLSASVLAANVDYRFFARGSTWEASRRAAIEFLVENAKSWEESVV
jgi:2-hydroxychromene-2-carboxylate isomerase